VWSLDRVLRARRRLPLRLEQATGPLALLLRLVASFGPSRGASIVTRAAAPAGAGLGGSSTLGIAAGAALDRWTGSRLGGEALLRRVMNLEAIELRVPTGNQDYLSALNGGLAAYHHEPDGTRREALPVPPDFESRLVLAYTGQPRQSGFSNWDMFQRFIAGEVATVRRMEAIAGIAREVRDALAGGDLDRAGRLIGEEGRLRYRLAPSVAPPSLLAAGRAARRAGALGVKVCGAGGGGCLVALSASGRAEAVRRAIEATGARILPCRLARTGLRVERGKGAGGLSGR
jgi:D-glycero-alpha-D-manno-heptose-7-phosphate kinase